MNQSDISKWFSYPFKSRKKGEKRKTTKENNPTTAKATKGISKSRQCLWSYQKTEGGTQY